VGKPCILHWGGNHFVVLTRICKNLWSWKTEATVIDPGYGFLHYNEADFRKHWQGDRTEGFALLLVPTERFGQQKGEEEITLRWRDLLEHVMPHRAALLGVLATLAVGGLLGMVFPFLTQAMIDRGIEGKNLHIISLLLLAQLLLSLGQLGNDLLRGWLTLKCTSQISISFIHRFLTKLTRLPLAFFESRNVGDIMQRILLARAVYHLPFYIFLDEATNALDSHTEQEVIRGMRYNDLYGDRTVVMVAHRLSTIRCADHIVVMENGGVAEQGTHEELLAKQGAYYRLVKNQL
jgi:ABC-type bacteriocin/lantibiotic exporter with double-glycine peptidase domain